MINKCLGFLVLLCIFQTASAKQTDIIAFCGGESRINECDPKKLEEFNNLIKNTDAFNVAGYSKKQKAFFDSVATHCGALPDTCQALINWQRSPASLQAPEPFEERFVLWKIALQLFAVFIGFKLLMKGLRFALGGASAVWSKLGEVPERYRGHSGESFKDSYHYREAKRKIDNSSSHNPNYFDNHKVDIDFGFSNNNSSSSEREPDHDRSSSSYSSNSGIPRQRQWRVVAYDPELPSNIIDYQVEADTAEEARYQFSRDRQNMIIKKVTPY